MSRELGKRNYTIACKVDLDTQTAIIECANHPSGGSVSNLLNSIVQDWLTLIWDKWRAGEYHDLPITFQRKLMKQARARRTATASEHYESWLRLQHEPDQEYEDMLTREAQELGLPWPPVVNLITTEHEKVMTDRVIDDIIELWNKTSDGIITLRDLSRKANLDIKSLKPVIKYLEQGGFIRTETAERGSTKICRIRV